MSADAESRIPLIDEAQEPFISRAWIELAPEPAKPRLCAELIRRVPLVQGQTANNSTLVIYAENQAGFLDTTDFVPDAPAAELTARCESLLNVLRTDAEQERNSARESERAAEVLMQGRLPSHLAIEDLAGI